MNDRDFKEFLKKFNADIRDRALGVFAEGTPEFKENVFTEIVTDILSEAGVLDNAEVCHHEGPIGRGTGKVSGYSISDEGEILDLFTSVFLDASEPATAQKEPITLAAQRAARFAEGCIKRLHEELEPASDAHAMARAIYEHRESLERIRIFVLTDGVATIKKLDPGEIEGIPTHFDLWDAERLFRVLYSGIPRDEIEIDFVETFGDAIPCLPMPKKAGQYMAYLAILPGEILCRLYDEYGSRLLELNVRSFLQARGKVNRGIRDTLRNEPDRFLAYNNGIVITVDDLQTTVLPDGRPAIRSAKGVQIVNGGQTTASIHRAWKQDKVDMSHVFVPAKITIVETTHMEEIVQHISLYANTQNVIQMADFSANDPFHVRIEQLSERVWCPGEQGRWFYERARGQYQDAKSRAGTTRARRRRFDERTPASRKFTKTDLARFECSWQQLPHQVSTGAQKNFVQFMQDLKRLGNDREPDETWYKELVAKAILFKEVQKIVRQEDFPAYRANIVTYLIAYISSRSGGNLDFEMIWDQHELSEKLRELLRDWSHEVELEIVESASGRNITEWAKKEDCWKAVKALPLPIPEELPPELRSGSLRPSGRGRTREQITPRDLENIARCKEIDGATWLRIHAWGKDTGELQKWQYGIAHTLSSYAALGWQRSPSPKQAKHAVIILEIVRQHEVDFDVI